MNAIAHPPHSAADMPLRAGLLPLVLIIFFGFLAIGVPLPTLSLHVHDTLGFGTLVVGCVIGIQSLTTVLIRHRAGTVCDHHGPRRAVLLGLPLAVLSGVLYLLSAQAPLGDGGKLALLVLGRITLGLGESLFITGTMAWGIARLGSARTGKVMSWQGIAMYAALGLGAPLGLAVQSVSGFAGVAAVTIAAPLLALFVALALPGAPALPGVPAAGASHRVPFHRVVGLIWRPGLVQALATVPFAAMAAFLSLDYASRGWAGAGLALTGFTLGYVGVRLFGSHLPDRHGIARVAGASLCIEAFGQFLLWLAPLPALAVLGALLTGIGYSLIFPAMGVEATRRVPAAQRGRAVGNFIAFFDIALGVTGPAVGLVAGPFGFAAAFLVGALATLAALAFLLGAARVRVTA